MELFQHLKTIIKYPSILRPYKRIILLSHMRANTSLFGHLLGSNPEIEGYYEQHMGYYSRKSFIRQKLQYFAEHKPKKNATYMFDKVLAIEHYVNTSLFGNDTDKIIIMIREPNATIASIINLYKTIEPNHIYTTLEGASGYYSERLTQLINMAKAMKGKFVFIEAESITQNPDETLTDLSQFLTLKTPLTKEYKMFRNTGKKRSGDSSDNLTLGVITPKVSVIKPLKGLSPEIIEQYNKALAYLRNFNL
jgi:hypothetical protein